MSPVLIALITLGVLVCLWFALNLMLLHIACGRNDRFEKDFAKALRDPVFADCQESIRQGVRYIKGANPQEVSVTSFDGLKLVGEFLPQRNARGTVIMFHGWKSSPYVDFSAGLPYYQSLGLNALLVHQRAQGKSEGRFMTFGIRERHDVHAWVRWHEENFPETPVILVGLSMGASTVLMSCGEAFEPCVKGVIADCGFTSPHDIICKVMRSSHLPAKPLAASLNIFTRLFAGFGLREYSTVDAMKQMKLPLLLAHGERDGFVPCHMSQSAFDACVFEDKVFLCVPDATHGKSFLVQPEEYKTALREFFTRCLDQ